MVTDKKTTPPKAGDKQPGDISDKSMPEAAVKTTDKKAADKKTSRKAPLKTSSNGFPLLKALLILVVMGALGFAGWKGWAEWKIQLQERAGVSDSLQTDIAAIERRLGQQQQSNRQTVQQQSELISQLEDQLYSVKLRLNSQAERILQLGTASRGDWLLSEAAYLIRLANQRLQVERSTENPLAILENVDNIFVQLDDPELLPVRRALAEDIAALRMTSKIDREGIFLEVEAISGVIDDLLIVQPVSATKPATVADNETVDEQNTTLLDSFERFSQKLGQLIVVRKRQQPIEPLLTSNEQSIIQHNIYLLLEQAQSALLREEQIIYSASLEKTAGLLQRYYQLNSQSQALIERLNLLSERSVIQQLPDISGSIAAVQTMLNLRQSRISDGEQQK